MFKSSSLELGKTICVHLCPSVVDQPFVKRVVIASNNPGKLRELSALLKPMGIEAAAQGEFAVPEADEPHFTFLENALAKARHASNMTGLPALADDVSDEDIERAIDEIQKAIRKVPR